MTEKAHGNSIGLSVFICLSLIVGVFFGAAVHQWFPDKVATFDHYLLAPLGKAFLRLIQFVVVPLVFSSLILSFSRIGNAAQVGRCASRLAIFYGLTSAIAVFIGISSAVLLHPGTGMGNLVVTPVSLTQQQPSLIDWLVNIIPVNPFETLSTGNLLQTIVAAFLVNIGVQAVGEKAKSFLEIIESVYLISERILSTVLYLAPIGVFALVASVITTQGLGILVQLFVYMLGLLAAFTVMVVVYTLILLGFRVSPLYYAQSFFAAIALAFGTASSNATLPIAMQNAQENYGLQTEIASFAIPLGTALKRDGSAIFQSFTALFIAQIYNVPMTTPLLAAIAIAAFLISYSTPGIPGSGMITMTTVLAAAGLPVEGVAIVAGIDRFTDGFKSVVNLMGNTVSAIVLGELEKTDLINTEASLKSETFVKF